LGEKAKRPRAALTATRIATARRGSWAAPMDAVTVEFVSIELIVLAVG
jgi:hypothetical protein